MQAQPQHQAGQSDPHSDFEFVAIQYAGDPRSWLRQRLPKLDLKALVKVDTTYLALVPRNQVRMLQQALLEGVEPPFQRKFVNGKVSPDPAIDFSFNFNPDDPVRRTKIRNLMRATLSTLK